MTSAARPTFLPAMGGHSLRDTRAGPISLVSAKELPAHTKLKFRKPTQGGNVLGLDVLKEKLRISEAIYAKTTKNSSSTSVVQEYLTFEQIKHLDTDDLESEYSSLDDEDEDETFELMKELEKIKQERSEEAEKVENEAAEAEMREREARAVQGNPLLNDFDMQSLASEDSRVKRRWDDDVIFKNQSRGEEVQKKRFINDMLRSDFHRKFMSKYMK